MIKPIIVRGRAIPWGGTTEKDKKNLLDWRNKIKDEVDKINKEDYDFDKFEVNIIF